MNVLASEGKSHRPETITAESQYACHDSMKYAAKITFSPLKLNPPEQKKLRYGWKLAETCNTQDTTTGELLKGILLSQDFEKYTVTLQAQNY